MSRKRRFDLRKGSFIASRWLTPGMGVKRWLILLGLGALITGMGFVYVILVLYRLGLLTEPVYDLLTLQFLPVMWRIVLPFALGGGVILLAVFKIGQTLLAPFRRPDEGVAESLYHYSRQGRGPNIVAIGGGTGMPTLLRGLREYTRNITAVVTVADDGGSSGRLRRDLGLLPPGDFRNNIAALSRDEALLTQVLQYRFGRVMVEGQDEGENGRSELQGHAFGNLLLAALTGITGSFDEALVAAQQVLGLRGRVFPSTLEPVELVADVIIAGQRQRIKGESVIPRSGGLIEHVALEPAYARAYPPVLKAILQADLIVMGPGSLYTSILPNLLIPDLAEALQYARAPKVYVCNLATQPGETDDYTVADHVEAIRQHLPNNFLDIVLANNNLSLPPQTGGGQTVYVKPVAPAEVMMVTADLVDEKRPWRHDSDKLARAVLNLLF
jgi:uncharacterized cofD-like protein